MLCIDGTKRDAILALHRMGVASESDADRLLEFLVANPYLLSQDEYIEPEEYDSHTRMMGLLLFDNSWYISLKRVTIILAALLLDIRLTEGLAATALSLFGYSTDSICSIEEHTGEKCILVETLQRKNKTGDLQILLQYGGKCCNPISECIYRDGEKCSCTIDDVKQIYQGLCGKNIFKKHPKGDVYRYQI